VPGGAVRITALLALSAVCATASEVQIQYSALSKILAQLVFTQEGRKYVRGDKDQRCNFAYLEHPEISGNNGHLWIRARFTGRSARNFLGRCVGLGDSFDLQIFATPYYQDNMVAFKDVRVESVNKDGIYIRLVRNALAFSLTNEFKYRLFDDAKLMLERKPEPLPITQELRSFHVREIKVTGDALVLNLDFTLSVK
jgi:hypothetical protein